MPILAILMVPQSRADDSLTEDDLMGDIPVVLSVTRLPQSTTDTPMAITVLDRAMIEASGFIEIPDLLRLVPGFQVGLSWRDHHTAVTYHGQSDGLSRRMQVLIDGRVAVGSLFGLVDWDRLGITIEDIVRIEVIRGPAGVAYGSNAFTGAINIVTREISLNPGWRFTAASGSRDTSLVTAQYAETGDRFDYRGSVSYYHTDGFKGVNDQSIARSARFQGRYQMDASTHLDFQLARSQGPWGRGAAGTLLDPVGHKNAEEQNGNFRFTHVSTPGNEWYVQFGFSTSEEADDFFIAPLSTILGVAPADVPLVLPSQLDQPVLGHTFDYQVNRHDLEFQQLISGDRYRLAWGGGYRSDQVNIREITGIKEWTDMETYRFQGNIEYRLTDSLLFNMGAIHEDNDINEGETSWRLGLNYTLLPGHVLRSSVAQGWRQPFLLENSHNVALRLEDGTPLDTVQLAPNGLDAEQLTSYELGYIGRWFRGRLSAEVKFYREEYEHEVEYLWDPTYPELVSLVNPGAILDVNGGGTVIEGFETGVQWHPDKKTHVWLSYAYADADHACDPMAYQNLFSENSATPEHTASLLVARDFGQGWQVSAGYYYLDEMAWILWGADTDSYERVDLRLAKHIRLNGSDLKLELIGQNLGGDYYEFNALNKFETRTFMRATLQFH